MTAHKISIERLHRLLDTAGIPANHNERAVAFGQLFNLSKPISHNILDGTRSIDSDLLEKIAHEFEVDANWLLKS